MPFAIITTTNARRDIQMAIDWENERSPNLGERFLASLQLKINALSITPFMGSIRYENVRCTATDIFQYLINFISSIFSFESFCKVFACVFDMHKILIFLILSFSCSIVQSRARPGDGKLNATIETNQFQAKCERKFELILTF